MSSEAAERVAARIHELEAASEQTLPAGQPYVLRLDGVAFRNYTTDMAKPFDPYFTRAMILTAQDLMYRCAARSAYCQSDEISLLFEAETSPTHIIYAGRVQKIVSVMAALAAARFNYHIGKMAHRWHELPKVRDRILSGSALFDARVFSSPTDIMAGEGTALILWYLYIRLYLS